MSDSQSNKKRPDIEDWEEVEEHAWVYMKSAKAETNLQRSHVWKSKKCFPVMQRFLSLLRSTFPDTIWVFRDMSMQSLQFAFQCRCYEALAQTRRLQNILKATGENGINGTVTKDSALSDGQLGRGYFVNQNV